MALVAYARVSTRDQDAGFEAQVEELRRIIIQDGGDPDENLFSEKVSSVAERAELSRALRHCRARDRPVVTKLDRLARSIKHFHEISDYLAAKGAGIMILNLGGETLDTTSPTGKLVTSFLMAVSEYEREIMLERQRDGIDAAKMAGKYRGRKPTSDAVKKTVLDDLERGFSARAVADRNRISRRKVFQIKAEACEARDVEIRTAEADFRHPDQFDIED